MDKTFYKHFVRLGLRPRKQIQDPGRWKKMQDEVRIVDRLFSEMATASSLQL